MCLFPAPLPRQGLFALRFCMKFETYNLTEQENKTGDLGVELNIVGKKLNPRVFVANVLTPFICTYKTDQNFLYFALY